MRKTNIPQIILTSSLALTACSPEPDQNNSPKTTMDMHHNPDQSHTDMSQNNQDMKTPDMHQSEDMPNDMKTDTQDMTLDMNIDMHIPIECTPQMQDIREKIAVYVTQTKDTKSRTDKIITGSTYPSKTSQGHKFTFEENSPCKEKDLSKDFITKHYTEIGSIPGQTSNETDLFITEVDKVCTGSGLLRRSEPLPPPQVTPSTILHYNYFVNSTDHPKIVAHFSEHSEHDHQVVQTIPNNNSLVTRLSITPTQISGTLEKQTITTPLCETEYQNITSLLNSIHE